jgi:hypothetical protein
VPNYDDDDDDDDYDVQLDGLYENSEYVAEGF